MDFVKAFEEVIATPDETILLCDTPNCMDGNSLLASQAVHLNTISPEPTSLLDLQLVQKLFLLPDDKAPHIAVICGMSETGDGAELVCARVAEVLATQVREDICLIDANLKEPMLHRRYNLETETYPNGARSNGHPKLSMNQRRLNNLWILPGAVLRQSCSGLSPEWVRAELSELRKRFGFLLVCAPPLEGALDALLWGRVSDGIVLVFDAYSTDRADVIKVRRCLDMYKIRLLGAVVNQQ